MPISLCCIVLLDIDFKSCSIQMLLNTFAYLTQIIRITTTRSSLHYTLAYMLTRINTTPHVIMLRSWRTWIKVSLTNVGLGTLGVSRKATWSLSHPSFACLLTVIIAFYSVQWNCAKGVAQNIHGHVFLMLWAFLLNRWASKFAWLHNHIVLSSQMTY
jgi:hypothetical protein